MLYKKNVEKSLSADLFKNPTSEYRGTPFWAWNCELDNDLLGEQIEIFKEMGFGGFHMHPRTGLVNPYLSDEFMNLVKFCVSKAKDYKMLAYLYDEDRWPSGAAGGLVTKDEQYRSRYLCMTTIPYGAGKGENDFDSSGKMTRTENGRLLKCYDVELDENGFIRQYKTINKSESANGMKWFAYIESPDPSPWYNNQTYVNTLQKEAIDRFIEITYNSYKNAVGEEFGNVVPSIFTDEPQFSHKTTLDFPTENKDVILPWSDDLNDTYFDAYGEDLLEHLPELIWELPNGIVSGIRYHYHDHVTERFTQAFADNCGKWCDENGLMLTGHMMEEPTLRSQTAALGEAMRAYRSFGLPGIDMLCNSFEFTTAKQAQSASRQLGKPGVLSELYGVTGWHFDFRGHKIQGDWQAALGITTRVPHLSWASMAGEAKRDYPASINYQSPWYKEYRLIEDHFSRINTAMTRGKAIVHIGVIHPIESYWLHWGPSSQTKIIRDQMDENFQNLTNWLLLGGIDFDFICESLLPLECPKATAPINVGEMTYDTIVVPSCETIRFSTLERLSDFKANGGNLIFMGEAPKYVDAKKSTLPLDLWKKCMHIPFERASILTSLDDMRDIKISNADGSLTNNLIYQLRQDNDCRWLFISQGKNPTRRYSAHEQKVDIIVSGSWDVELYDTMSGEIFSVDAAISNGKTIIKKGFFSHDSVLFRLLPAHAHAQKNIPVSFCDDSCNCIEQRIDSLVPITLEEPNVFLLDYAEFAIDDDKYELSQEILRADNIIRRRLGYPTRMAAVAQPWSVPKQRPEHTLHLRYRFNSDVEIHGVLLAVEDAEKTSITFNGKNIENNIVGYFTDKSIKTVNLGSILKGENVLELSSPYSAASNPEWCYILGDFGVRLSGSEKSLTAPIREIGFGDIASQGLPFYGGNLTYHIPLNAAPDKKIKIEAFHYCGALLGVYADGIDCGKIVFAPYALTISAPKSGIVDVKLFGNRANSFGPIHKLGDRNTWIGPDAWRSVGDQWSDSYSLYPTGILSAPIITVY